MNTANQNETFNMNRTYWNGKGKYQTQHDQLEDRIPYSGSVENPKENRHLEKLRKAGNCYYDLYNNGLCNLADEFRKIFGIASSKHGSYKKGFDDVLKQHVESKMNLFIEKACIEQGIEL